MGWLKQMVQSWLEIEPSNAPQRIVIQEPLDFNGTVIKNQIWYRGDASELDQLYTQLASDQVGRSRFWAAAPDTEAIRKIHSGLPALMVDTLAYIVQSDLNEIQFDGGLGKDRWETVANSINFNRLLREILVGTLVSGDGAVKISMDTKLSPYPMAEFYDGGRVEYLTTRGKITGICFYTDYWVGRERYRLREVYRPGGITYELYHKDKPAPLSEVEELKDLKNVSFPGNLMPAVPVMFYKSARFPGRGKSIYDAKTDVFDAHDEVISQWMDALRAGRVQKYIPEDMIPRDPNNGAFITTDPVNSFGTNFVKVEGSRAEGAQNKIETIQPEIRYEAFRSTYAATLDMCLQGIISPATLGIDLGKMSSADAQREKKDITGHTRNTITAELEQVIPKIVTAVLDICDAVEGIPCQPYEPSVSFGEYGAPDFDSRIQTVGSAATASVMSIEAQVDELWGSSKDEKWKASEVERIKREKGIEPLDEPGIGDEAV